MAWAGTIPAGRSSIAAPAPHRANALLLKPVPATEQGQSAGINEVAWGRVAERNYNNLLPECKQKMRKTVYLPLVYRWLRTEPA